MSIQNPSKINLTTAVIVCLNAMIGAGIFSVPSALGAHVGPAGLLTYLFVIVAIWCMGQSMARLAQIYPGEGSFYLYASRWGGHTLGLIAAGAYIFGLMIAMGLLMQIAGNYLHSSFPSISATTLGTLALAALIVLNIMGAKLTKVGQLILIYCTLLPMVATIILCLSKGSLAHFIPFAPYGIMNIFTATRIVIFGFFGFEAAASLFHIVENPERNVPKAVKISIALVGLFYLTFAASIIYAVPFELLSSGKPLSDALLVLFPNYGWIVKVIHVAIIAAILGTVHSMIWSASELALAYAKKIQSKTLHRLIEKKTINQRTGVLFIGAGIFAAFSLLHNLSLFFSITALAIITAFILSMIALLCIKAEWKSGKNYLVVMGLATACIMLYFSVTGILEHL